MLGLFFQKIKKGESIANAFQKILDDSTKLHSMKKPERFIRNLKTKIYKYMTSVSENVYIDKLDDIVNEYNNNKLVHHRTIKMKFIEVKDNTYIDSSK